MPRNWSPARARSPSIVFAALLPLCLFFATGACREHTRAADIRKGPDWVRVTEKAPWQPRDSQAEYVHDGHLWILGGWISYKKPNLLDVWKSPDGRTWTRTLEAGPWVQTDLPVSLVFQNRMWLMGGRKVPGTECSNKVWSSTDGVEWTLVTASAGWSARLAPGFAVFSDRMWVLGGTEDFYQNNDTTMLNDVWSSADGRDWRRETADAGWSKRANGIAITFDNKLWVLGGGARNPRAIPTNDVWSSEDGVNWKQVTASAPWKPRLWFSAVVYRDHLWVLGGWSETDGNLGDVWYTKDGRNWTELKSDVIWTKRHEHSAFVFQDKIWVAGGAAEPSSTLDSQVWSLEIPPNWFEAAR
jgi:hypothetical protein